MHTCKSRKAAHANAVRRSWSGRSVPPCRVMPFVTESVSVQFALMAAPVAFSSFSDVLPRTALCRRASGASPRCSQRLLRDHGPQGFFLNVGAKNGGHVRPPGCSCSSQHNFGLYVLGRLLLLPLLFNDLDVPLLRARAVLSPASFVAMIVVPCYLFEAPWESMLYRECSGTGLGCRSRGQSLELSSRVHRLCNAVVHYQLSWLPRMLGSTIR